MIREEVARACREYAPGGSFIPCLTYGGEGSIFPGVNDISWMRSAIRTRSISNNFRGSGKFQNFIRKHQIQTGVCLLQADARQLFNPVQPFDHGSTVDSETIRALGNIAAGLQMDLQRMVQVAFFFSIVIPRI